MADIAGISFDEAKVDAVLAPFDQGRLPGAVVGIAIRGRPVYRKGFGLANMELPVVLAPTIRMRLASISKHMASLAYMLLCEDGKAGIDDPLGKYLPELHPVTQGVTMRQLMGNISGLHDAYEICHQFNGMGHPVTSAELLSFYRDLDEVNAAPGTAWIYNNGGFLLLSFAIERITGEALEDVLRTRLFEPVHMYSTLLRRWDTDFVANSAVAHTIGPSGDYQKSNFFGNAWAGEGGVVSTVDDMLRWLAHMDAPVVGSAATWRAMKSPQTLANGTSTGYGMGLHIDRYRGVETLYHPGGGLGSSAQMLKVPSAGLDVVVLVNRQDVHAMTLAESILDVCLTGLEPIGTRFTGPFLTGVFRSPTTDRVIELFAREGRQIASIDGMDMPVEPDSGGALRPVDFFRDVKQAVMLPKDGAQRGCGDRDKPASIRLSDFGNIDELVRQAPPATPDISPLAGRFHASTTGTEARIVATDHGPQLVTRGRFGSALYTLDCLADGVWRARAPLLWYRGGILSFDRKRATFRFFSSLGRMWGLNFRREV